MTDSRAPSQKLDQYMVRFPDGLRDRIKNVAAANNRSMNAEIVATLEEQYPAPQVEAQFSLEDMDEMFGNLAKISNEVDRDRKIKELNERLKHQGLMLKWTIPTENLTSNFGRALYLSPLDHKKAFNPKD